MSHLTDGVAIGGINPGQIFKPDLANVFLPINHTPSIGGSLNTALDFLHSNRFLASFSELIDHAAKFMTFLWVISHVIVCKNLSLYHMNLRCDK